jgi:hypothetical protein
MAILKVIFLAVILMSLVVVGLAFQTLFKKGGKFPNTHIGSNKYMKSKGVTCAQTFDKMEQAKIRKELLYKRLSIDESNSGLFANFMLFTEHLGFFISPNFAG